MRHPANAGINVFVDQIVPAFAAPLKLGQIETGRLALDLPIVPRSARHCPVIRSVTDSSMPERKAAS
jgi:hypothetical protein